jgi:hypothetical protein
MKVKLNMKYQLCTFITKIFNLILQCKTYQNYLKRIIGVEELPHCIFLEVTCYNKRIVSKMWWCPILFNIMIYINSNCIVRNLML